MKPIPKHNLVAETESALREAVLAGQFGEVLPGVRILSKALAVSPLTVSAALKRLAEEGLLFSEGERRRMRVNPAARIAPGAEAVEAEQTLWFVTPESAKCLPFGALEVLSQLTESLSSGSWRIHHRVMSYRHSEKRTAKWDAMLHAERPSAMVAWSGKPSLAEWAVKNQLRTIFLGGDPGGSGLPMLAIKASAMVDAAVARLIAAGHWRICLPLCNRPAAMVGEFHHIFRSRLERAGMPFLPEYHLPESEYEGAQVIEAIVSKVRKKSEPTAWIFMAWREYVAASCAFRSAGIRVPEDASVILLSFDPAMDWHRPSFAHFEMPQGKIVQTVLGWVRGQGDHVVEQINQSMEAVWVPGESLGPPPAI